MHAHIHRCTPYIHARMHTYIVCVCICCVCICFVVCVAEGAELQAEQVKQYIDSIPDLLYWDRTVALYSDQVGKRENNFKLAPSNIVATCTGNIHTVI